MNFRLNVAEPKYEIKSGSPGTTSYKKMRGAMQARSNFLLIGEMAERTKAAASKAVIPYILGIGGSNPSLSTTKT